MKTSAWIVAMALVVPWLSLVPRTAGAQAKTVWKLASGYTDDTFHTLNLQRFAKDVAAATEGRLVIEVHANNSLVRLGDIATRVSTGEVAAGETILSNLAGEIPVAGADSVPFIVNSYDDARRLWQSQRPVLEAELARKSLVALYAVAWPPQGLYANRPIRSTADLAGLKMRTYNAATRRIAEQLGARPVDVMMTELDRAMASGRVETMITSGATGIDSRAWEHLKYFYDIRAWYPKNIVLVNQAAWNALDPALQKAVRQAAAKAEARGWQMSQAAQAASLAELASRGVHIDPVEFDFRDRLRRYGERFSVEWVRATGPAASAVLAPYYLTAAAR